MNAVSKMSVRTEILLLCIFFVKAMRAGCQGLNTRTRFDDELAVTRPWPATSLHAFRHNCVVY